MPLSWMKVTIRSHGIAILSRVTLSIRSHGTIILIE
jgi:hypothetical protein